MKLQVVYEEMPLQEGSSIVLGAEPSFWRVLKIDREGNKALLLSDFTIGEKPFYDNRTYDPWPSCSLRNWLNAEYFNTAFTGEQKKAILETESVTMSWMEKKLPGKKPDEEKFLSKDRIFLLSREELEEYLPDPESRICGKRWWLRGSEEKPQMRVLADLEGDAKTYPYQDDVAFSVRPALWLDLDSAFFRTLVVRKEEENYIIRGPLYGLRDDAVYFVNHHVQSLVLPETVHAILRGSVRDCPRLEKLQWKDPSLLPGEFAFRNCPLLRLPVSVYVSENKAWDELAQFMPDDREAAKKVLKDLCAAGITPSLENFLSYQRGSIETWGRALASNLSASTLEAVLEEWDEKDGSKEEICRFLAVVPYKTDDGRRNKQKKVLRLYPAAEKAASYLDRKELVKQLLEEGKNDSDALYTAAVYAGDEQIDEIIGICTRWSFLAERIYEALILYNSSITALAYLDAYGALERCSKVRGVPEDQLRKKYLEKLGLNERGIKTMVLDGREVLLVPDERGRLSYCENEYGKKLRRIEVEDDHDFHSLMLYRMLVSTCAAGIKRMLYREFLNGKKRRISEWKALFAEEPFMRLMCRTMVFSDGEKTFRQKEDGRLYDVRGNEVFLTSGEVCLAHPMEMDPEDLKGWKDLWKYRKDRPLFAQMEEPVLPESLITKDRYTGRTFSWFKLSLLPEDGIWHRSRFEEDARLEDCTAEVKKQDKTRLEVRDLTYPVYNRKVNHIAVTLEKLTARSRVYHDDPEAGIILDQFNIGKLESFIRLAQKRKCSQVLPVLIEQLHRKKRDLDPQTDLVL